MKTPDLDAWKRVAEDIQSVSVSSYPDCIFTVHIHVRRSTAERLEDGQSVWGILDRMDVANMIETLINKVLSNGHLSSITKDKKQ